VALYKALRIFPFANKGNNFKIVKNKILIFHRKEALKMPKSPDVSFATKVTNKLFPKRAAEKATKKIIGDKEAAQSIARAEDVFRNRI